MKLCGWKTGSRCGRALSWAYQCGGQGKTVEVGLRIPGDRQVAAPGFTAFCGLREEIVSVCKFGVLFRLAEEGASTKKFGKVLLVGTKYLIQA